MNARSAGHWTTTTLTALAFLTGGAAYVETASLDQGPGGDTAGPVKGALVVAHSDIIARFTNPATGAQVKVFNGGYGSAIATDPWHSKVVYLLTDRGPNVEFKGGIAFAVPDFHPQIDHSGASDITWCDRT